MTHKDFKWDRNTWKKDYEGDFEAIKDVLVGSIVNHFPNYSLARLKWGLLVDASNVAVGAVLYHCFTGGLRRDCRAIPVRRISPEGLDT